MTSRGILIVLEGCDRAGKTTQANKLVDRLNELGRTTKLIKFPGKFLLYPRLGDETTSILYVYPCKHDVCDVSILALTNTT